MKSVLFIITILFLSTSSLSNAQNFNNASEYLTFVENEQKAISKSMWEYTKALAHSKNDNTIVNKHNTIIKTIERAIAKINKANGFESSDYKEKVLKYLNFNLDLLNQDYAKIIDMKVVAEQSYNQMEAYMLAQEMADKKMQEAQKEYEYDFYNFANKYNIEIVEEDSDLNKKMKLSNQVFKHYNTVYLTYFKVHINEVNLIDAIKKSDVSALEQNANALALSSKEGLEKLDTFEAYSGDKSIIEATKELFNYFIDESENKVPVLIDFLLLNENFEAIKKALDNTPANKRTNEQINSFNEQVTLVNNGAEEYNKTNAYLNQKANELINKLNTSNQRFLDKHIPKE